MKNKIYACLLAGGKGTRLWPLSTNRRSKSFVSLGGKRPLFVDTIERLDGIVPRQDIIVVVDRIQAPLVRRLAKGVPRKNVLVEPFGRSTAAAIGLAAIKLGPDDLILALPTDALIENLTEYRRTIKEALRFVRKQKGALMCIGVKPVRPDTSYGYIKVRSSGEGRIYSVRSFVEKPDKPKAVRLLKDPSCLWNAGIFVFRAGDILEAMARHAPSLYRELINVKKKRTSLEKAYRRIKDVSIDYQVMEKADNLFCAKGSFSWRDLGSWKSVLGLLKTDKNGNARFGRSNILSTTNSLVYNATKGELGVLGLDAAVVVRTEDGVLVSTKDSCEKIKKLKARR